jgi:hypothetical protein
MGLSNSGRSELDACAHSRDLSRAPTPANRLLGTAHSIRENGAASEYVASLTGWMGAAAGPPRHVLGAYFARRTRVVGDTLCHRRNNAITRSPDS